MRVYCDKDCPQKKNVCQFYSFDSTKMPNPNIWGSYPGSKKFPEYSPPPGSWVDEVHVLDPLVAQFDQACILLSSQFPQLPLTHSHVQINILLPSLHPRLPLVQDKGDLLGRPQGTAALQVCSLFCSIAEIHIQRLLVLPLCVGIVAMPTHRTCAGACFVAVMAFLIAAGSHSRSNQCIEVYLIQTNKLTIHSVLHYQIEQKIPHFCRKMSLKQAM